MTQRFNTGDRVKLSDSGKDNECYAKFRDRTLTVASVATAYMPAKEFYAQGKPDGYHPGYDGSAGDALYDFDDIPVSLYDWELNHA